MSFPHKHGGGNYGDKCGPMENMHPVSKGWICVVLTEGCLMLKNHSHCWRRTAWCYVLRSDSWVSHRHCIRKLGMYVCLIWI